MGDILDDLVGLLLADREVVARGIERADHVDKGVDGKRVVLAAHAEVRHLLDVAFVAVLHEVGLFEHLARVTQKRLALLRHHDAAVRSLEDSDAHLDLQIAQRARDGWLRHIEPARGLGDAAALGDADGIDELLQFHGDPPN